MPVEIEPWMDAVPLHLGFAVITAFFLSLFFAPLGGSPKSLHVKGFVVASGFGVVFALTSWIFQLLPMASPWVELTRSAMWWSILIGLASILLYVRFLLVAGVPGQTKAAQNAVIQEQLLIQSVAQVKKNISLRDRVRQAKRNNLRSQMNPHFLFNVLTGIQHLLFTEQGDKASDVFRRFRKLLMQGFITTDKNIISIQQELDHVGQYIDLESIRLTKPIVWKSVVDSTVSLPHTPCPKFLLQPLVENAIWHGLSGLSAENPAIELHIFWDDESLVLQVHDNGKGLTKKALTKKEDHQSRGTAIIKERLELLRHPGKLELRDPTDQDPYSRGTVAQIRLPLWALEPPPKEGDGDFKKEDAGLERL
jgi:sensor histidine kinase YesM